MPRRKRENEWDVGLDINDYPEEDDCCYRLYLLNDNTVRLALSAMRVTEYIPKRWRDGGEPLPDDKIRRAHTVSGRAHTELMMPCDSEIAKALDRLSEAFTTSGGGGGGCNCCGGGGDGCGGETTPFEDPPPPTSYEPPLDTYEPAEGGSGTVPADYVCGVVEQWISDMEATLETINLMDVAEFIVSLGAGAGVSQAPSQGSIPDFGRALEVRAPRTRLSRSAWIAIAGALATAALILEYNNIVTALRTTARAMKNDLYCAAQAVESRAQWLVAVRDLWYEKLDATLNNPSLAIAQQVAYYLVSERDWVALFDYDETITPDSTCDGGFCDGSSKPLVYAVWGVPSNVDQSAGTATIEAEADVGYYWIVLEARRAILPSGKSTPQPEGAQTSRFNISGLTVVSGSLSSSQYGEVRQHDSVNRGRFGSGWTSVREFSTVTYLPALYTLTLISDNPFTIDLVVGSAGDSTAPASQIFDFRYNYVSV